MDISIILGVWGAVTGSLALLIQARDHFRDRSDLRVKAKLSKKSNSKTMGSLLPCIRVTLANRGRRKIRLMSLGIEDFTLHELKTNGVVTGRSRRGILIPAEFQFDELIIDEADLVCFEWHPVPIELVQKLRHRGHIHILAVDSLEREYRTKIVVDDCTFKKESTR